jgi:hypothetical protein
VVWLLACLPNEKRGEMKGSFILLAVRDLLLRGLARQLSDACADALQVITVPEIIDTVFAKTSPKRSFSMTEYERFGLVFTKTRVYKFGHRTKSVRFAREESGSGY